MNTHKTMALAAFDLSQAYAKVASATKELVNVVQHLQTLDPEMVVTVAGEPVPLKTLIAALAQSGLNICNECRVLQQLGQGLVAVAKTEVARSSLEASFNASTIGFKPPGIGG
jgi:hypothetical protein